MSSIPSKADRKPDVSKILLPVKPPFSTERKTTRPSENYKKGPYGNPQPLAKSQTNLHLKGRKQSALKTTITKTSKASSTATMFKEGRNEVSPRDKVSKKLSEMQRSLLRRLNSQHDKSTSKGARESKLNPHDSLKPSKANTIEANQTDNLVPRLSYKSMSSLSSDKKSAPRFDQASKLPEKNLFGVHFESLKQATGPNLENEHIGQSLKSSSSCSQNLNEIGNARSYNGSASKLFEKSSKGVSLSTKANNTSMPILDSGDFVTKKSSKVRDTLEQEPSGAPLGNFKKSKRLLTSKALQTSDWREEAGVKGEDRKERVCRRLAHGRDLNLQDTDAGLPRRARACQGRGQR
jgi:hypothetical protein